MTVKIKFDLFSQVLIDEYGREQHANIRCPGDSQNKLAEKLAAFLFD